MEVELLRNERQKRLQQALLRITMQIRYIENIPFIYYNRLFITIVYTNLSFVVGSGLIKLSIKKLQRKKRVNSNTTTKYQ